MKRFFPCALACLFATLLLMGCRPKTLVGVAFPDPPVEIVSNADFGMELINMFNIIQIPDGTYRLYFIANPKDGIAENEHLQNLYYAESKDGFHYELKGKLMDELVEQSVFLVKDKEYPYRMVGNQWIGEKSWERGMFLWKSKDGLTFTDKKMLYDFLHDTQNVMIPRGNRWKLYSRVTQEHFKNRRMTVAEFDKDGEQIALRFAFPHVLQYPRGHHRCLFLPLLSGRWSLRPRIALRPEPLGGNRREVDAGGAGICLYQRRTIPGLQYPDPVA